MSLINYEQLKLSQDFLNDHEISKCDFLHDGGQKTVFVINRNGQKQILKIVKGCDDKRVMQELEIYSKFNSGDIPQILECKILGDQTIIFEEFIDGDDLRDCKNSYLNNSEKIGNLMTGLIEIMTPMWKDNLVHRDLNPSNIRISSNGKPKILDFGIAKLLDVTKMTRTGFQPHTRMFSSPEQFFGRNSQISYRTDFFCLGIIAFFLYHGELPFGETEDLIEKNLGNENFKVEMDESNPLYKFIQESLRIKVSSRPRTTEILINLLS